MPHPSHCPLGGCPQGLGFNLFSGNMALHSHSFHRPAPPGARIPYCLKHGLGTAKLSLRRL
jgi:hypothetical protein